MKVYDVRPLHLKKHYNEMIAEGKTDNMVFNLNKLLKKFFFFCMEERYISINPCSRLTLPKSENKIEKLSDDDDDRTDEDFTVEVDPFTDEEIKKIKKALNGNTLAVFMLGLATGMRRGELLGLTVGNVDLENNLIKVRKALKRIKLFADDETYTYEVVLDGLKTKNSRRDVPIPTTTQAFFKRYIRSQRELFFKFGKSFEPSSFFFTTEGCRYIDGKNFLRAWERGLKRAGVRYRKFHNVRHTYATRLFENGVQLKTVSMLLGHANISITADVYVHVMPKEKDNAVENLNYMFL
jgi:integrase